MTSSERNRTEDRPGTGTAKGDRRPPQTQQPRPTWGEQTPDKDQERTVGGGGTSSDSDGQRQD